MARRSRVGRKNVFNKKQLGIGLLLALVLMYLPLLGGALDLVGQLIILAVAIWLLIK